MPKKQFLKLEKKKTKHVPQAPQSADEYLAAGVDFEEAGEKWRGGDAAKSTRFFIRAINNYDEGMARFPNSFDLAYNKARVQYELTQYPKLLAQTPYSMLMLLRAALFSSRVALGLNRANADALFNTAQILTSIVEAVQENRAEADGEDFIKYLEEALELFQQCLIIQEQQYNESEARKNGFQSEPQEAQVSEPVDEEPGGVSLGGSEESGTQEDQWATVIEPVTKESLLDTILAQLETLTVLCGIVNPNIDSESHLSSLETYSTPLLTQKLPILMESLDAERAAEVELTKANFLASIADANFRAQRIDNANYEAILTSTYEQLDLTNNPEGLCDKAEAYLTYSSSTRNFASVTPQLSNSRWQALSLALKAFGAATKLPSAENLSKIHLARGDTELLRFQMGLEPTDFAVAKTNAPLLLKNAGTFYRGAVAVAKNEKNTKEIKEGTVKEAVVLSLGGDGERLTDLVKKETEACRVVLEEAVDDGVVLMEWLADFGIGA